MLNDSVMNKNHRDQTQFLQKKTLGKGKWVCYYLYIHLLSNISQTNKQTNNIFFNDIQAPGLHIIIYLQYLQDSDHNDDNNINYKNYINRGHCATCGKITHKENHDQSQNHF